LEKIPEFENEEATSNGKQEPQIVNDSEEEFLKDYVRLQDGETVIWQFSTDKAKRRRATHDFGKGPADVMYFMIRTAEDPDYEREWRVSSKKLMRAIVNRYLNAGKTMLEISRRGSSQNNTVYRIRAVDDDKVFVITNKEEYWEQKTSSPSLQQQQPMTKRQQ
jgi:hypothetical protein